MMAYQEASYRGGGVVSFDTLKNFSRNLPRRRTAYNKPISKSQHLKTFS